MKDYINPLYDLDDDATVAEFCLQERVRGRLAQQKEDVEDDLLEDDNEDE